MYQDSIPIQTKCLYSVYNLNYIFGNPLLTKTFFLSLVCRAGFTNRLGRLKPKASTSRGLEIQFLVIVIKTLQV